MALSFVENDVVNYMSLRRGISPRPNSVLMGEGKNKSVIEVSGGQTGIVAKPGCSIENLTIRATADANGDAIAIDGGDCSFTVKNVNIELSRTANRAIGIYERGTTPATIRLQNIRITGGNPDTRGIVIGDAGGGSNKTVLLEQSWISVVHNSISCEAASAYIDARSTFFNGSADNGAIATYSGGVLKNCHLACSFVLTGTGGSTFGFWNTVGENRLINQQPNGYIWAYGSFFRTMRSTNPTAKISWYTGDINVVDVVDGPITWQPYRFTRRVIWPMKIQDAIDSCLADDPAPGPNYRYTVKVGSGGAYDAYTPADYVDVVLE